MSDDDEYYSSVEEDSDEIEELDDEEILVDNKISSNAIKKVVIINDEDKITSNYLNKYEIAKIILFRIQQIERGGKYFINCSNLTNARDIAVQELINKKCPLIIEREIDYDSVKNISYCERWKVNEMSLIIDNIEL